MDLWLIGLVFILRVLVVVVFFFLIFYCINIDIIWYIYQSRRAVPCGSPRNNWGNIYSQKILHSRIKNFAQDCALFYTTVNAKKGHHANKILLHIININKLLLRSQVL